VALHLDEYNRFKDEFEVPVAVTQLGIAASVSVERSNLPRELNKLKKRGFVFEKVAHVTGKSRRIKTYFLTRDGMAHAEQIKGHFRAQRVSYINAEGVKKEINLFELYNRLKPEFTLLQIINKVSDDGVFDHSKALSLKSKQTKGIPSTLKPEPSDKTIKAQQNKIIEYLDKAPKIRQFFGRTFELKKMKNWVNSDLSKVIVINGIAGIGKTTLVSRFISQYSKYKSTYWYRCHESDTINTIIEPISHFLGKFGRFRTRNYLETKKIVNIVEISDILEEEFKNINAVFVFDDFHKVNRTIIQLFSIIFRTIENIPGIKLIVLSRRLTPFYDARDISIKKMVVEFQLEGLDKKSSKELLGSIKLAKLDDTGFDAIYESTSGHPLALELLTSFSELGRKSDFSRFLEDEIFAELTPDQKNILNLASVYRYPVELQALFTDGTGTYEDLSELIRRSLIYKLANDQYDLHDLVREFIYKRFTEAQKIEYHTAANRYYTNQTGSEAKIERLFHLLSATEFKAAASLAVDEGQNLISEGHLELEYLLEEIKSRNLPIATWSEILILKGDLAVAKGDLNNAFSHYDKSLQIMIKAGKESVSAKIYRKMAVLFSYQNNWEKAIELYEKALRIFEKNRDLKELAKIYNNLALAYYNKEDHNKTLDFYQKSIEILTRLNEPKGIAITYNNLGNIYEKKRMYAKALEYYEKSLEIAKASNDKFGMAAANSKIGVIHLEKGNLASANHMFRQSIEFLKDSGDDENYITLSIDIGNNFYQKQRYNSALEFYQMGISTLELLQSKIDTNNKPSSFWQKYFQKDKMTDHFQHTFNRFSQFNINQDRLAKMYDRVGNIYRKKNDWTKALENHEKTLELLRKLGQLNKIAMGYNNLGIDYKNIGDHRKALYYYKKSYELLKQTNDNIGLAVTLNNIAKIYESENKFNKALDYYKDSLKLSKKSNYSVGIEKAYRDIGTIYQKKKESENASKYLKKAELLKKK
jgi:tetratricopeptide (TPR) repeat protein/DNA-binding MarR family transcriptional regulator